MKTQMSCYLLVLMALYADTCSGAAIEANVAEGYFVVDAKALNVYINQIPGTESLAVKRAKAIINMTEDIGYLLTEANQLLATLNRNALNIQIRIRKLDFLTTDVFPANSLINGNLVTGGSSLKLFADWLTGQKAYSSLGYDFAMLWTGYDLYGDTGIYTAGIANIGKICDSKDAVSVVEFNATYLTAVITAHELGHVLGASHDGIASDQIMAIANSPNQKRRWTFADCAAVDIKEFLPLLSPNCLTKTNAASTKPATSWVTYKGRLFDHDAICERVLNDTRSYACLSSSLYQNTKPKGDQLCQQLFCHLPGSNLCVATFTSEGLICDTKKRCDNGKCVADTSAASSQVDTDCVLGDQKVLDVPSVQFTGTCSQYVKQEGQSSCYTPGLENLCCATCQKYKTTIKGCEYGDKSKDCATVPKSTACAAKNAAVCCYTCRATKGKRSTDEDKDVDTIKSVTDKEIIKTDYFKVKVPESPKVPSAE